MELRKLNIQKWVDIEYCGQKRVSIQRILTEMELSRAIILLFFLLVTCEVVLFTFSYQIRGFIKGQAPGKLTSCERGLAINLPGCFCLLFLLSFIRKTKNAWLKNPTDLLYKNVMKPLIMATEFFIQIVRDTDLWGLFLFLNMFLFISFSPWWPLDRRSDDTSSQKCNIAE